MKILWLVNIIMPDLAVHLGDKPSVFGGWLSGALEAVRGSEYELVVVTNQAHTKHTGKYDVNGVRYYITAGTDGASMRAAFRAILSEEKPDVVHLYGTEFPQSWAMAQEADPAKLLVTVQGLVTYCIHHVYGGVPERFCRDTRLHRLLRRLKKGGESIEQQRQRFAARSEAEIKTLKRVRYINGGTAWGTACTELINPAARQLPCELILRDSFYTEERWSYEGCEKHSIFTLDSVPLKGFDMLLRAMPMVLERFPDAKVYVMANKCKYRSYSGLRRWVMNKAPDYDWYIQGLIEKKDLKEHLVFLGYLDEQAVKEHLLRTHVFVSASCIENHSTALGEAMITGVPSIASCVGGLQEMIDHGEDGFLYPFDEPYMLAWYICKLFSDRDLAEKISQKGQLHANRTFNRDDNKKRLLAMYDVVSEGQKEATQ